MNPRYLWLVAVLCGTLRAEVTLQAYGEIPASAKDSLGDTIGGLGSAVAYDAKTDCVYMMPDRGAGDGTIDFRPRCHRIKITRDPKDPARLVWHIEETILFRDKNGRTFTGLLADNAQMPTRGGRRCLDTEAIAVAPDGTLYVSDEYRPALLQFDRSGKLLREIPMPAWYQPLSPSGTSQYLTKSRLLSGREENQGAEALGILPDGKRAVLIFQSALTQDGGRRAGTSRILVLDLRTGEPVAEYGYAFGPVEAKLKDLSVNDLAVVNAHTFLVLERDGLGRDGPLDHSLARYKSVWLVDTRSATNLLKVRGQPYDQSPAKPAFKPLSRDADVKFASKTQLFNLPDLVSQLHIPVGDLAAKWEGIALLPPKSKREFHLLMTADNDFLNPTPTFNGVTTKFRRAQDAVPTQFFEILATRP
ncbi:MAG: esterase-like activity of phytase family protein [Chthoniobacterales bacterium]